MVMLPSLRKRSKPVTYFTKTTLNLFLLVPTSLYTLDVSRSHFYFRVFMVSAKVFVIETEVSCL